MRVMTSLGFFRRCVSELCCKNFFTQQNISVICVFKANKVLILRFKEYFDDYLDNIDSLLLFWTEYL